VTDLENCLRRDLNKIAERVTEDSIRPLRVRRARRTRPARLLAPIAAMAAVVAVIAGVSLAAHTGQAPAPATQAGLPLYYVTVTESTDLQERTSLVATVHDSVNGAVLARSSFPGMPVAPEGWLQITGGGNMFIVSVGLDLFRLRVAPDGRSMQLSPFSIPWHPAGNLQLAGVALSPDGTTLAITASGACNSPQTCFYDVLHIVSLTTGAARTWSTQVVSADDIYAIGQVGWAGNDHVVFGGVGSTLSLLNVSGRRGGSLHAARVLPVSSSPGNAISSLPLVTPDASTIFLTTTNGSGPESVESIKEMSARTGKTIRVLDSTPWIQIEAVPTSCVVYALAAKGVHVLLGCENVFGRLDNGKFTRLPGKAAYNQSAAW
jgi:hypothetical protein